MELVKSEIEHREPIAVGFFVLQYAKLRMLKRYHSFKKFSDTDKYEEPEMDTDSLHLDLSENNLGDVILPEKRAEWDQLRSKVALIFLLRMQPTIFSPELDVMPTRNMIRESRDFLKKSLDVQKCCACVATPPVATIERVTCTNIAAGDSIKELWKTVEMDPCQSIAKCYRKQSTLLQPIEDFERFSIVLLRMNKQRKGYLTFIQK